MVKILFPGFGLSRFRVIDLTELKISDKTRVNGTNIYTRLEEWFYSVGIFWVPNIVNQGAESFNKLGTIVGSSPGDERYIIVIWTTT